MPNFKPPTCQTRCTTPGFLVLHKPPGISSHTAIAKLKPFISGKIGHTGTLDPFASGMLVAGVGEATKFCQYLVGQDKRYRARVALGSQTNTDDATGEVIAEAEIPNLSLKKVEDILHTYFLGTITQKPPKFSALKLQGKAYYQYARKGVALDIPERKVTVFGFDNLHLHAQNLWIEFDVHVGSGTYIRSIARDLGEKLGTKAHLSALHRTHLYHWSPKDMVLLEALKSPDALEQHLQSIECLFTTLPSFTLSPTQWQDLKQGRFLSGDFSSSTGGKNSTVLLYCEHRCIGLAEYFHTARSLRPKKIYQKWPSPI